MSNAFLRLRDLSLAQATRPFLARGKDIKRCPRCFIKPDLCICEFRAETTCGCDVVLLLHHDEVFKPTNTGRLIADILPKQTHAVEWARTQCPAPLAALLKDPARYCVLVFPGGDPGNTLSPGQALELAHSPKQTLTLILLDGTWRQACRMARLSNYLAPIPRLAIPRSVGGYAVRQAHRQGQLSTAEAGASALELCGQTDAATRIRKYFQVFNLHYAQMRGRP